jgi:4-alpha-glucanotransferase
LFQRLQYHTFSWYMELLNAVMNQLCMLVIDHVSATN